MIDILAISDRRPGHFRKTESLLLALGKKNPVNVSWLEVPSSSWFSRNWSRLWLHKKPDLAKKFFAGALLKRVQGTFHRPSLIISCGANTLFANGLLASHIGCPNVFIGSLRRYDSSWFWRVVTVNSELKGRPGFVYVPGVLTLLDRARMVEGAETLAPRVEQTGPLWGMLIGGDGAGYRFSRSDMLMVAEVMNREYARQGVRWMITTSRRTGGHLEDLLEHSVRPEAVALFSRWSMAGGQHYHGILELSQRIVCTDDSQMMIAEAIATGKAVASLYPASPKPRSNSILDRYCEHRLLVRNSLPVSVNEGLSWPATGPEPIAAMEESISRLVTDIQNACLSKVEET